jgi:hypothetical protein
MVRAKTGSRMVKWTGAKEGVRTDADALVNIAGGLRAVGTQSDSIRFLPGFAGKWRGIEVWSNPLIIQGDSANTAADTKLSYVRISGVDAPHDAKGGPLIVSSSANSTTFEMNHSVFSDNKGFYGGLSLRWVRTAEICSSTFTGNTATVGGGVYHRRIGHQFRCLRLYRQHRSIWRRDFLAPRLYVVGWIRSCAEYSYH